MNPEKMMDAISGISDKYIEKYAVLEPVKHDRRNRIVIQCKWFYRLCACLTVFMLAIGIGVPALTRHNAFSPAEDIPLLNNTTLISSVSVSAYELSETGIVKEHKLSSSVGIPVSIIESTDNLKGMLFSVDSATRETLPMITILSAGACEQKPCELFEISGMEFNQGVLYFFFTGENIADLENLAFYYSDDEKAASFEVLIKVSETNSGYSAKLQSISSFSD